MKGYIIILLMMVLSLACIPEEGIKLKEDRLTGSWKSEKILYKEYGTLQKKDITESTGEMILDLHYNSRAQYKNLSANYNSWGSWEMHQISSYNHHNREAEYQLIVTLSDPGDHIPKEMVGYITRLADDRFLFHLPDNNGETIFHLSRLSR